MNPLNVENTQIALAKDQQQRQLPVNLKI